MIKSVFFGSDMENEPVKGNYKSQETGKKFL